MRITVLNYEGIKEFDEEIKVGLTQVAGETNVGKSSLIRAIWDYTNNSATENELSIFAQKDEKMIIKLGENSFERDKKNKKYIINGIENNKPGRVKQETGFDIANFQMQQEPLFLVGETPGTKYNYLIGKKYDNYLECISKLTKEANSLKKEHTFNTKELDKRYVELDQLEKELEEVIVFNYKQAIEKIEGILKVIEKIEKFRELKNKEVLVKSNLRPVANTEELIPMFRMLKQIMEFRRIKEKTNSITLKPEVKTDEVVAKYKMIFSINKYRKLSSKMQSIEIKEVFQTENLEKNLKTLRRITEFKEFKKREEKLKIVETFDSYQLGSKLTVYQELIKKKRTYEGLKQREPLLLQRTEKLQTDLIEGEKLLIELRNQIKECPLCGRGDAHVHG